MPLYPGCPVTVAKSALTVAELSPTPTSMARALLLAMFDVPTLLVSNLKGGSSKRPGMEERRLQKLDDAKLDAIYGELLLNVWYILVHEFSIVVFTDHSASKINGKVVIVT